MISIGLFALSFVPLIAGNELTKEYAHLLALTFAILGAIGCYRRRDLFLFLTPNSMIFFYTTISIGLGAWGHANGYVIRSENLAIYEEWQFMNVTLAVVMLSLSIFLAIDFRYHASYQKSAIRTTRHYSVIHLIATGVLLPLFLAEVDLSSFGGVGDFSIIGKSVFAIVLILFLSKYETSVRYAMYVAIIALFAAFSIDSKREAILLVLPMLYLELLFHRQGITWKNLTVFVFLGGFLLALILAMSIARGYGGFGEIVGLLEAIPLITRYIGSDIFLAGLLNNIEANYFFFHALNAIEMILQDSELIAYGSTIVKPLFLIFPRSILSWKPESMITLYTMAHDPAMRARGGSWPISYVSELFWNFWFLSLVAVAVSALLLAKVQFYLLKSHRKGWVFMFGFMLFMHMNILILARGSGLDLYLSYVFGAGILFAAIAGIAWVLKKSVGRGPYESSPRFGCQG